ncbi:MAG: ferrochelatase [Bacteroidetes bacterium 46-16]|nr:MAG: ferrochelatase [Bacteroidetes bacterium 46-16]
MPGKTERAVILMNLGSPDSTAVPDVRKYLREFLMDERVLDISYLSRFFLVNAIIAPTRAPKSAAAYRIIWTKEGSPLVAITRHLQQALKDKIDAPIEIAMRYGNPSIRQAFDNIAQNYPSVNEVILLPLYPHYAMASYETAVVCAEEALGKGNYPFKMLTIKPFYDNDAYIHALADSMRPYIEQDYDHLLFSYHGIPERQILKEDVTNAHCLQSAYCCSEPSEAHKKCYRHQCFETTKRVVELLGIPEDKHSISFQSRLGRTPWLRPFTDFRLAELPAEGKKKLLIISPAFVSDCLETLEELAERGKETFMHAGGQEYTYIPCMNVQPAWVSAIVGWYNSITAGEKEMLLQ